MLTGHVIRVADAYKAYLQAMLLADADTFVTLPSELWKASWRGCFKQPMVRLLRALYGHPRAGAFWDLHLRQVLQGDMSLVPVDGHPSAFFHESWHLLIVVYVVDVLAAGPLESQDKFWAALRAEIQSDDVEELSQFLGRFHHLESGHCRLDMMDCCRDAVNLCLEVAGPNTVLRKVSTPYVSEGILNEQDYEVTGEIAIKASSVLMKLLWVCRLCRPGLTFCISMLAGQVDKLPALLLLQKLLGDRAPKAVAREDNSARLCNPDHQPSWRPSDFQKIAVMQAQVFQVKNTFLDLDEGLEVAFHRRQQSEPATRQVDFQAWWHPVASWRNSTEIFTETIETNKVPNISESAAGSRSESPEKMPRVVTGDNLDFLQCADKTCQPGYSAEWNSISNAGPEMSSNYMMPSIACVDGANMLWHYYPNGCGAAMQNLIQPGKMMFDATMSGYQSYQEYPGASEPNVFAKNAPAGEVLQVDKDFPLNFVKPTEASFSPGSGAGGDTSKHPSSSAPPSGQVPFADPSLKDEEWIRTASPQSSPQTSPQNAEVEIPSNWQSATTVMARNLPNKYNQQMLIDELNSAGFAGAYDFLYLPIDPETNANRGYAFINFINPSYAWMMRTAYEGRKMGKFNSDKVVSVVPAALQGFEANYAHYSTARVMRGAPQTRPLFLRESGQKVKTERRRGGRRTQGSLIDMAIRQKGEDGVEQGQQGQQGQGQQGPTSYVGLTGKTDEQSLMSRPARSQVRFCQNCGGKAQAGFRFCQFCGTSLHCEVWGA
eukprot:s2261_g10.t1